MDDAKIKVLVVDDHQMFAEGLIKALSDEDDVIVVGSAGSVAGARAAANTHTPDVILMDYELSDGDGAQATQFIKEELPNTKVVMLTSFTDESVLVSAIEAGCSGFVTKHKAVEEVAAAVRAAYEGEALISPSMLARLLPKLRRSSRGLGSDLTPRELEVLKLLAEGLANTAIAERLVISLHTVRNHVQSIIMKLQAHSKLEAVTIAVREGVIQYPQTSPRP
ncbi:MAG: response regulator [Actinomycetota bacterium]|nr:response regulator transcription factor [Actinomycetota bacterium]